MRNLRARLASRLDLVLENIALRHQLMVLERSYHRSPARTFSGSDRCLWVLFARWWPGWRQALTLVQPQTVVRWQRTPWWRHLLGSRGNRGGRPRISAELQALIPRMQAENPRWGSMRILGELKKLGFEVSNSSVRRYRGPVHRRPRGQSWRTFFYNHAPYVRDALAETIDERTRRALETLLDWLGGRRRIDHTSVPTDEPVLTQELSQPSSRMADVHEVRSFAAVTDAHQSRASPTRGERAA
jgi:hypothetical protein